MQFIVYDSEVFSQDWLIVFNKNGEETVIVNDSFLLQQYYEENKKNIFVGFNNKHYDDYIFKGIMSGIPPKDISSWIIDKGKQGWEFPGIKYYKLNTFDVKQDISKNLTLSLKEAEGNMGMSIEESNIPFNIDRKLTDEELQEVIKYCKHDVKATTKILIARKNDISTRMQLLNMFDLPITEIGKTNAKITATILNARSVTRNDEFIYDRPDNVMIGPKYEDILGLYMSPIKYENTLNINVNNIPHVLGYGGLHGAKPGIFSGNIWYLDVKSYYPTLMLKYDYASRNLKDFSKYEEIYNLRLKYKAEKNPLEQGLKLVLNTKYGAMKNKYNPLFDPKQANQVCITGQLFLIDLLEKLEPYTELLQSNTDGVMFISHNDEIVQNIINEWSTRTKMDAAKKIIDKLWQKDVNNYIYVQGDYIEVKGGYVKNFEGGAYYNNTTTILDKAVVDYFVYNIPIEETINNCNELIKFQYICKKGPTYKEVYWITNSDKEHIKVNHCNRVFASKNKTLGNLYKLKEDGRRDSIADLPEHCIVINEDLNETTFSINDIDKEWYINQAKKRVNDFLSKE